MESIERFDSVPDLLRALLKESGARPLSIRELSRKLGYSSDRTVGMVLQGHREMAPDMMRRVAEFAQFSARDRAYMALLTERQKQKRLGLPTDDVELRLSEHKQKKTTNVKLPPAELKDITPWYAYTIIEILGLAQTPLSTEDIRSRLRGELPIAEVEVTLAALTSLNFIRAEQDGFYRQLRENEYITTPPDVPSVTARAIHRAQLIRAAESIEEQSVDQRELIAKTLTVSVARIPQIKKRIRELMEELANEFVTTDADDAVVAQLNLQFYQQSVGRKS